jgi:regulatory protein
VSPERAFEDGLRLLARRPLTEAELCRGLAALGHAERSVKEACRRLRSSGYIDDLELAVDFILTRSRRLGHGPSRLLDELVRRGVARPVAESALGRVVERGELDPREQLREQIRRRRRGRVGRLAPGEYARVYNALLRAGFEADAVRQELDPQLAAPEPSDSEFQGPYDDVP